MKVLYLFMNMGSLIQPGLTTSTGTGDGNSIFFSSGFHQPKPPLVKSEFRANWNQHKWDADISHIASGFLYHSPAQKRVRVDEAHNSELGSSLFDYTNATQEGILNRMWTVSPTVASPPHCFQGYVNPAFPLIPEDILVTNNAVYGGVAHDALAGEVTRWDILYQGTIPVTVLLDGDNLIRGYDFIGIETRARAVTRFFNIVIGPVESEIFDFPC